MQARINTHCERADGTRDSFASIAVDIKESPMPHHVQGLSWTATGYGSRLPSRYMVRFNGRWRRVYSVCVSNTSTEYIGKRSENLLVRIDA